MNEFTKDKPTSQQLIELIDNELDITICKDVVYGLDFEYKQLQQERDKYKSIVEKLEKIILELDEENRKLFNHFAIDKIKELEEGNSND